VLPLDQVVVTVFVVIVERSIEFPLFYYYSSCAVFPFQDAAANVLGVCFIYLVLTLQVGLVSCGV
jgi:hypothetical protein